MDAILVERDYKGEYERFALTPEEFEKEFPETVAKGTWPIQEADTDTISPLVHIWFAPCVVGDDAWIRHFTNMEWGLPESDIANGNLAYVREDLMQSLKPFLPAELAAQLSSADEINTLAEKLIADIKTQLQEGKNETSYGEPQAWVELENGRSIEVTLEQEGLDETEQFFSVRLHCSESEQENDTFHGTLGVVHQFNTPSSSWDDLPDALHSVLRCNESFPVVEAKLEDINMPDLTSVEVQKTVAADFMIYEAFSDLEDYPDAMYTDDQRVLDCIVSTLAQFDIKQLGVLQNAASYVADEIRNGRYAEKVNCYEVINNGGPYPMDIAQLMVPTLSVPEMESLWSGMRQAYEQVTYGFTNPDGRLSGSQMVDHFEEIGGKGASSEGEITMRNSEEYDMEQNNYLKEIYRASEALSKAVEAVDMAEEAGIKIHPSIGNRLNTAKLILSELIPEATYAVDLNTSVRAWYCLEHADELGQKISPSVSFADIVSGLNQNQDIYMLLGVGDSLVRERTFRKLSEVLGIEYDVLYTKYCAGKDAPDISVGNSQERTGINRVQHELAPQDASEDRLVSCIVAGDNKITEVPFESLQEGDTFFVQGEPHVVGEDAHYSGDASYDGYLLRDTEEESWFPEDLSSNVKPYVFRSALGSSFYIPNALHVERNDWVSLAEDDKAAARMAEEDGVKLIHGMAHVSDGVYVDTPENRDLIVKMLEKYPEYLDVGCKPAAKPSLVTQIQSAAARFDQKATEPSLPAKEGRNDR